MITAEEIIKRLKMQKHPEGGYFVETYRSAETVPDPRWGNRSYSTAIYYMLVPGTFSEMHCLGVDEIFHFYRGDPLEMLNLYPDGTGKRFILGSEIEKDMHLQVVISAGTWQGTRVLPGGTAGFSLMGTTVAPGFEYADYRSGNRDELTRQYPQFRELITALTGSHPQ
jgi:hypothetical protein